MTARVLAAASLAVAFAATATLAADFPMNDQVREQVRAIRSVAVSPDGRRVAAMITETTANGGLAHLWLLAPNAAPRQLTFGPGDENIMQWSADGSAIYFIGRSDNKKALFRLPLDGGEPVKLQLGMDKKALTSSWDSAKPVKTADALAVNGLALSPDGKTLALWADDADDPAQKARKDRKDDSAVFEDEREKDKDHLYRIDPATGVAQRVDVEGRFASMRWADDGSGAMLVTTDPKSDETGPDATVWRIGPDGGTRKLDLPKSVGTVALLPGGRTAYMDQCDDAPPRCNELFVADKGAARDLTRGFDGTLPGEFVVDRSGDLLMNIANHTRQRFARISTKDGAVSWFDGPAPAVSAVATNASLSAFAFIASGSDQPPAVYLSNRLGGPATKLATPAIVPKEWPAVQSKLITWQNEGMTIEGLLYMPKLAPGQRAPLVTNVHGGPAGHWSDAYSNLVNMMAAEGWATLLVNPRGSTAYGTKFLAANKNDLGGADYRDIMTGIDKALADYPLDRDRTALIGYSYGGEITGFAEGRTTRFKAIISGAPVINQFSEYGTENGSFYDRWYFGKPYERVQDAWRQSPLAGAPNAKTPFLMVQGEADTTDPLGQSIEMYRALKQYGAPVALLTYPRENHGPLSANFSGNVSTEAWHGVDVRRRMFAFLRAAFAGDPDPIAKAREDGPPPM